MSRSRQSKLEKYREREGERGGDHVERDQCNDRDRSLEGRNGRKYEKEVWWRALNPKIDFFKTV